MQHFLNVKSEYSFLRSCLKFNDYFVFAQKNNLPWLSLIDDDVFYGQFKFYQECIRRNIKPVIGFAFHLSYVNMNKSDQPLVLQTAVICLNQQGYYNALYLSSLLHQHSQKINNKLILKWARIKNFLKGLMVVFSPDSASQQSQIGSDIRFISRLQEENKVFSFLIGLNQDNEHQAHLIKAKFQAKRLIWFQAIYALHQNDEALLSLLRAIKLQTTFEEVKSAQNKTKQFWSIERNQEIWSKLDRSLIQNQEKLISQINLVLEKQDFNNNFVKYQNHTALTNDNYLLKVCQERLAKLNLQVSQKKTYHARLDREFAILKKKNFINYFLVIADYVNFAKTNNIYIGPGRGSATGSLISYLLGITTIDPIAYNLLFERFLNAERISLPDIDIDIEDEKRKDVIKYLCHKYGKKQVCLINTFSRIGFKNAVRDLGRVLQKKLSDINGICNLVNEKQKNNFHLIMNNKILQDKMQEPEWNEFFQFVQKMIGLPRQEGTHAAGVIISSQVLNQIIPFSHDVQVDYQFNIAKTQLTMEDLAFFGLIKMDLLGLKTLNVIHQIVDAIKQDHNADQNFTLEKIPLDDKATYQLLANGDTAGIFQLESVGMTNLLQQLHTSHFEDIVATTSLFRPGAQANQELFIACHNKKRNLKIIEPRLNDILAPTFGVILYQEQVMEIARCVANFSLDKSDFLRQAISKKNVKLMNLLKIKFHENALQNGYSQLKITEIWNLLLKFADYGFNRSHAVAYSMIGYWMAFFKRHYVEYFLCALLSSVISNETKINAYLAYARQRNLILVRPSVNRPFHEFKVIDRKLYFPLTVVKHVGQELLKKIQQKAPFLNFFAFVSLLYPRGLNNTYNNLVKAGAVATLKPHYNISTLLDATNWKIIDVYTKMVKENKPPSELYDLALTPVISVIKANALIEIQYEKEATGFYFQNHPLSMIREQRLRPRQGQVILKLHDINSYWQEAHSSRKQRLVTPYILVTIDNILLKNDRQNRTMAFLTVSDETATNNRITVFATVYNKYVDALKKENFVHHVYLMKVKLESFQNRLSLQLLFLRMKPLE